MIGPAGLRDDKMIVLCGLSVMLAVVRAEPQLIGHRGIFTLREGQVNNVTPIIMSEFLRSLSILAGVQG